VSHSEFIRAEDGKLYFLETSARVGGANLSTLVEAATGVNLWREWAKIEILKGEKPYKLPKVNNDFAAIVTSLSKQEWPDLNTYNDPEVVWRLKKEYHAGLIIKSSSKERINQLVGEYTKRFYDYFFTTAKMGERPSN
jgi:biotin carboxylase